MAKKITTHKGERRCGREWGVGSMPRSNNEERLIFT